MTDLQSAFDSVLNKLGPFESQPHLAVAVSGGSDSMALAFLVQEWVKLHQGQMTCLIVDHGLRIESYQEALSVQQTFKTHQIPCEILKWIGTKPQSRLQEQARRARYTLLEDWCYEHHVLHLLIGHHRDDQRETYQLRQSKNSTPYGLSGMSAVIETSRVRLLRPLLKFTKSQLRGFLTARQIAFIEDPSNINPKFTRSILRQNPLNPVEKAHIHQVCQTYSKERLDQEIYINDLVCQCVSLYTQGYGVLNQEFFQNRPFEDQLYIMQRCLMTFGQGEYSPTQNSLKVLNQRLQEKIFTPQTLHGCVIFSHKKQIYIAREPASIKPVIFSRPAGTLWWDQRFRVKFSNAQKNDILSPLKSQGWIQLKQTIEFKSQINKLKHLPAFVRFGFPALWRNNQCVGLWLPHQDNSLRIWHKSLYFKFTTKEVYDIYFAPRYPLTRFTFVIV